MLNRTFVIASACLLVLAADICAAPPRLAPLARLPNGRVDSNVLFSRMAAISKVELPVMARLDAGKTRALVDALARNDGPAIDSGTRALVAQLQAMPPGVAKHGVDDDAMLRIQQQAAVQAYPELADMMSKMDQRRRRKQATGESHSDLDLLRVRLADCDRGKPCGQARTLSAAGAPPEALAGSLKARRIDAMAGALAAMAANAERMHNVAQSVIGNIKP